MSYNFNFNTIFKKIKYYSSYSKNISKSIYTKNQNIDSIWRLSTPAQIMFVAISPPNIFM